MNTQDVLGLFLLISFSSLPLMANSVSANEIPPDKVCRSVKPAAFEKRVLDRKFLVRWLLSKHLVSETAKDYNGDGDATYPEKVLVIVFKQYCSNRHTEEQCLKGDPFQLGEARGTLKDFFSTRNQEGFTFKKLPDDDTVPHPDPNFTKNEHAALKDELAVAYTFLTDEHGLYSIECDPKKDDSQLAKNSGEENPSEQKVDTEKTNKVTSFKARLRVRGKLEDIKKTDVNDSSYATFSVTDNQEAGSTNASISGVIAYVPEKGLFDTDRTARDLIPFIQIDRRFSTNENEVNTFGIGLDAFVLGGDEDFSYTIDFIPLYITDSKADTSIASINLEMSGTFNVLGLELGESNSSPIGLYVPDIKFIFAAGHVFDDGGNSSLEDEEEFFRAGAEFSLEYIPASDIFPKGFFMSGSYTYLNGITGEKDRSDRVELSANWRISKNYNFSIKYVEGEADNTFQDLDFIEANFGLRF